MKSRVSEARPPLKPPSQAKSDLETSLRALRVEIAATDETLRELKTWPARERASSTCPAPRCDRVHTEIAAPMASEYMHICWHPAVCGLAACEPLYSKTHCAITAAKTAC